MEAKQKQVAVAKVAKTQVKTKYICRDTEEGFTTDEAKISFLRAENKLDEINNFLLGSFTETGDYFIETEIVAELVNIRKIELGTNSGIVFADSRDTFEPSGKFHFALQFDEREGRGTAYLNLMESIERANGYMLNTNTYRLAKYTAPLDNAFRVKARRKFNIVTKLEDDEDTDGGQKRKIDVRMLLFRLGFLDLAQRMLEKRQEGMGQEFLQARLEALAAAPNGKRIIDAYNVEREKVDSFFLQNKKNKYRSLNDVLTRIIDVTQEKGVKLEPEVQQGLDKATAGFKAETERVARDIEAQMPKRPEQSAKGQAGQGAMENGGERRGRAAAPDGERRQGSDGKGPSMRPSVNAGIAVAAVGASMGQDPISRQVNAAGIGNAQTPADVIKGRGQYNTTPDAPKQQTTQRATGSFVDGPAVRNDRETIQTASETVVHKPNNPNIAMDASEAGAVQDASPPKSVKEGAPTPLELVGKALDETDVLTPEEHIKRFNLEAFEQNMEQKRVAGAVFGEIPLNDVKVAEQAAVERKAGLVGGMAPK